MSTKTQDPSLFRALIVYGFKAADFEYSLSDLDWKAAHEKRKLIRSARESILGGMEANSGEPPKYEYEALDSLQVMEDVIEKQLDHLARNDGKARHPGSGLADGGGSTDPSQWVDKEGNKVTVIGSHEKLSDHMNAAAGYSIGDYVRGAITGNVGHLPMQAQQSIGNPSAGGYLVPQPLAGNVIDLARAQSRVMQAGASTVAMTSKTLDVARVESDPTPFWRDENVAITESSSTFGKVQFDAKTCAILIRASLELVQDAQNFGPTIESVITQAMGVEMDRVGLFGSGSGSEPRGVYNNSGVTFIDLTDGESPATITPFASPNVYAPFSQAVQACMNENVEAGDFILSPRTWGVVDRATASDYQPLQPPRSVATRKMLTTTQVPDDLEFAGRNDASAIFTGPWNTLMYGIRTDMTMDISGQAGGAFEKMQFLIRLYVRMDVQLLRPSQFVVVRGVAPALS